MKNRAGSALARETLVGMIYDAALNQDMWPTVLQALTRVVRCDDIHFALYDRQHQRQILTGMSLIPAEANVEYMKNYFPTDKRVPRIMAAPERVLLDDRELISAEDRANSPFHQEFLPRYGLSYQVLSPLIASDNWFAVLVAGNTPQRGEISKQQNDMLRRFLPHLQRALQLHIRTHLVNGRSAMAAAAIDRVALGVLVLAAGSTILEVNASGTSIVREADGLWAQHNRLMIEDGDAALALRRFQATNAGTATRECAGTDRFLVRRPSGRSPYHVLLHRLPAQETIWSASRRAEILVFISDPDRAPRKLGSGLMELYGLTGAEARLAAAVANGTTLSDYAEERGVSVETVRFQMQQVLRKTDVSRQGDFIRLVARTFAQVGPD